MDVTADVFPVNVEALPRLHAYVVDAGRTDLFSLGGKLSYRLRRRFEGHWAWTSSRILTDAPLTGEQLNAFVEELWSAEADAFRALRGLSKDEGWRPFPRAQAEFVARGLFPELEPQIRQILDQKAQDLGEAIARREYTVRGWVVRNEPAISLSVFSRLLYKGDLELFAAGLDDRNDLVGLLVAAKTSGLKGEIVQVVGTLDQHRSRLSALTQDDEMGRLLRRAPDTEIVVGVAAGRREYDYALSTLRLVLRTDDFRRFNINAGRALKSLRMSPAARRALILELSGVARRKNLIEGGYSSRTHSELFHLGSEEQPSLRFGGDMVLPYDERSLLRNLREFGLFRHAEPFRSGSAIRLGLMVGTNNGGVDEFISDLEAELNGLGFYADVVSRVSLSNHGRAPIEGAIGELQQSEPHILLGILPETYDSREDAGYFDFKSLTVGRGIPSQVIHESTLRKRFALANIVLGILGKTGNIPFVLAEPLPYTDMVVGIDIARERKERLPGTINATAIARIYFNNGEFLRYAIHDSPLEGETIPERVLQGLFPLEEFRGKRVVIHRDGYFRGNEIGALREWAGRIDARFSLVEVIKTGTPRLYGEDRGSFGQPPKGASFVLDDREAFVTSSLPPFKDATPNPLRIRVDRGFPIDQAIDSVLRLTLLHYGSLRPPRLPVTIHYSDKIAYMVLRGIKPKDLEGKIPYWL